MQPVLVLDARQRSALAVTRSLGSHGIPVITAEAGDSALAGASRFSRDFFCYPDPQQHPQSFIEAVTGFCSKHSVSVIFPMTELTSTLLLSQREKLPAVTRLPFAGHQVVNRIADKCALLRLADQQQVPIPRSWWADTPHKLPLPLTELPYPLVLKPGKSWAELNGKWLHTSVRFAENPTVAQTILEQDPAFSAGPFLLQENVPGSGQGIFALYDHGRPLAFFAHRRVHEKPPRGGVSVLSESTAVDDILRQHAEALLSAVGWHGIAMVEFRATPQQAWLMEINTRFWGSLQLAIDAGVDFPWLLYQITVGLNPDRVAAYHTGQQLRWLLGDLDYLYLTLKDRHFSYADKLRTLADFFIPELTARRRYEINRWEDMAPFWWEIKRYFAADTDS